MPWMASVVRCSNTPGTAAAPALRDVGGEGARACGDRGGSAARGVMGSRRSVFHSGAHCGSGTRRGARDRGRGWFVVNGAGGVTGGLLVQLAAARGARVIATASAKKAQRIRDYGASEVLDYHGDWPPLVREITGGGAPKAVNAARAGRHHLAGGC